MLKIKSNSNGATMVEAAIVIPVLILFVIGLIDTGLILWERSQIFDAVRKTVNQVALTSYPSNAQCIHLAQSIYQTQLPAYLLTRSDGLPSPSLTNFNPDILTGFQNQKAIKLSVPIRAHCIVCMLYPSREGFIYNVEASALLENSSSCM